MGFGQRTSWQSPPTTLPLNLGEVHLWRASLALAPERVEALYRLLAPEEQHKADRFCFPYHRARYIAGRGQLRLILSRYLHYPPGALGFEYGLYGKPALGLGQGGDWLQFNVSHSEGLALYGVTRDRAVGVDLEWRRPQMNWSVMATHCFTPQEIAALQHLPKADQEGAFWQGWTRKEAYLKGLGQGLRISPRQVEVTMAPGIPAALLKTIDKDGINRWQLYDIDIAPDYKAAIAIEGSVMQFHHWTVDLDAFVLSPQG